MLSISHLYLGFELIDVSKSLPCLIRRPGLTRWLPTIGRDLQFFETYDDYLTSLGGNASARLVRSHWPPAEELGLDRWYVDSAEHLNCLGYNGGQYTHLSAPSGHWRLFHCSFAAQAIDGGPKV